MIFTKIEVDNYGIFRGRHVFDLNPTKSSSLGKPIILFGGKNGSGKTTLFEAVRLCLYGNSFQGKKIQKTKYHKYLRQRVHHSFEDSLINTATVSVELNYAQSGHISKYLVKRSWTYDDTQTTESLEVYQDGALLQGIDEEQWQDFIQELIPLGVSKLFFFDGEQIQNLAEDEADNQYLVSSLHSLLGLDLVERLQTDLRIYLIRKAKEEDEQVEMGLVDYENKQRILEERLDMIIQKKANVQSQIDRIQSEIENQEHQIAKEGGGFASKREELKIRHKKFEEEIEATKEKIRNLCSNLLPFSLVPDLCISLRNRLLNEDKNEQEKAAIAAFDPILESFTKEVRSEGFWDELFLPTTSRDEMVDKIVEILKRDIKSLENNSTQIIHHVSSRERSKLLDWIDKSLKHIPQDLSQLTSSLEKLGRQQQEVDNSLFRAPLDDVLHPFIQKLSNLHEELGALQENYRNLDEDLHKIKYEINQITRQIERKLEQKPQLQKLSQRLVLVKKVQVVLHEYVDQLRREKIMSLCNNFLDCFKWLSNKEYLIEKIDIDPNSFSINLLGRNGQVIPKNQLSAGEKQIYAVAMLWALARTSGRPLPFIIDTPLGRLDTEHRENIVQNFFPHASHQVILFSTDTEIGKQYFEELQPYISKAYHLEYDEKSGMTSASLGYFWEGKKEEIIVNELQ